ncbi:MAG: type II secretion system protein GspH [Deltaproteobacteria bacterium]|nr:MAG: type II secretion system protein GspH [Deltaproteobacteria bacterium]
MIDHDAQEEWTRRGFTLFELLVVMVIIGIAASLIVPRLGGSVDKMQLRTATRDLASVMRFARSQAVTRGREYRVLFDSATRMVAIEMAPSINGQTADSSENAISSRHRYQLPAGIVLNLNNNPLQAAARPVRMATFFPMGNSSGGSIRLVDARERSRTIRIDTITGLIAIESDAK